MKTLAIFVAFLLLIPVFAVAQDSSNLVEIDPDETGISNPVLVDTSSTATIGTTSSKVRIRTLAVIGRGIAVSPSDPMDFKMVKIGIGTVSSDVSTTGITVGVMFLDETRYKIREITISEGEAKGNIYSYPTTSESSETMVGSFELQSVMKEEQEIWAGTLTINGDTYHLYVIGAARKVNSEELKEKVSDYCTSNPSDGNCRDKIAEYCMNNPNEKRCQALYLAHCMKNNNLEDARCRDFANRYCDAYPEKAECRVFAYRWSKKYCEDNSDSSLCVKINAETVEYCMKESNQERCREFCEQYPDKCKQVVNNLAEYCINNENNAQCRSYCAENPSACKKVAEAVIRMCIDEPNRDECKEYRRQHPAACGLVAAELARFCIGNAEHARCNVFCDNYPNACKKVADAIDSYCEKYPSRPGCDWWCQKYQARCRNDEDSSSGLVTDVSNLKTGDVSTGTKVTNIQPSNTGG